MTDLADLRYGHDDSEGGCILPPVVRVGDARTCDCGRRYVGTETFDGDIRWPYWKLAHLQAVPTGQRHDETQAPE